jgi:nitroimidazol reductase NimA-like FMN-containing flavoprotein (pyridoxamine 5'-phosphate oxidase superfamily)
MRGNPKVCVEVDEIVGQHNWRTVLVFGRYEEIDDSAAGRVLRTMIQPKLEAQPGWWLPGAAKLTGGEEHHVAVLYRVRIDRLSGRHAARPVGT